MSAVAEAGKQSSVLVFFGGRLDEKQFATEQERLLMLRRGIDFLNRGVSGLRFAAEQPTHCAVFVVATQEGINRLKEFLRARNIRFEDNNCPTTAETAA